MHIKPMALAGLFAITPISAESIPQLRPGDPGLEATWDWTQNILHKIYYSEKVEKPTELMVKLPFYMVFNRLCSSEPSSSKDILKEDGWQLVHRNFGNTEYAEAFPYFTLYNKYRGLFMVMLYNAVQREDTFLVGELSFLDGQGKTNNSAALFTFSKIRDGYLERYDSGGKEFCTCAVNKHHDWVVFDYQMTGYDPALATRDPVLLFRLSGVSKSSLKLNGNSELDLVQRVLSDQTYISGSQSSSEETFGKFALAANKSLMHYRSVKNWYDELLSPQNRGKPWYGGAQKMINTTFFQAIPGAMALGGFIEAFYGGANEPAPWEPLRFSGQMSFHFDGDIERIQGLWAHQFYLKPGDPSFFAQRPVQKINWGILNFPNVPAMICHKLDASGNIINPGIFDAATLDITHESFQLVDPAIAFNPDSGLDLVATRVAIERDLAMEVRPADSPGFAEWKQDVEPTPEIFIPAMDFQTALSTPAVVKYERKVNKGFGDGPDWASPIYRPTSLLWEFRFRTREPTRNADRDMVMIRRTEVYDAGFPMPTTSQYRKFKMHTPPMIRVGGCAIM